ncbi:39S ribosomal protein L35, mitochondrial [Lucilia sericata]|uniref:39S ribosomal protein L35, mitochondrial n=1 Tax=Lucilia sericata TaxID=13632 RepID=UPI0018A7F427|nr:39S ribosomal protein L35, mitochondrial [Lucilia sericata]
MLRTLIGSALKGASYAATNVVSAAAMRSSVAAAPLQKALFSSLQTTANCTVPKLYAPVAINSNLLQQAATMQLQTTRDLTKFSLNKGKRKSVKAVIKRFRRLDWGGWVRTHTGRHKKMFKKSAALKRRLRQHIFTNSTQSWLLDSMVGKFWRRPKNWVDDPYAPYNRRDEFFATKMKSFKV